METKRVILAVALSIFVFIVFNHFFGPKPGPPKAQKQLEAPLDQTPSSDKESTNREKKAGTQDIGEFFKQEEKKEEAKEELFKPVEQDVKAETEDVIVIKTDLFTATFLSKGAGLKSFVLNDYRDDDKNPLNLISEKVDELNYFPFYFSPFEGDTFYKKLNKEKFVHNSSLEVNLNKNDSKELIFQWQDIDQNLSVLKKFKFTNGSYVIDVEISVIKDGKVVDIPIIFGPGLENNVDAERNILSSLRISAFNGNDLKTVNFLKVKTEQKEQGIEVAKRDDVGSGFYWASYDTTYFAAMFKTDSRIRYSIIKQWINNQKKEFRLHSFIILTNPGKVFIGPKKEEVLDSISPVFPGANKVISYGWAIFAPIAKILLSGINFVYNYIPNYGWAIVIFTVFLKILLFPLTYTSSVSMAKMQTLSPKIKAIKKKYKNLRDPDQRKKMNMETMALYKQEKVNPAGGCLPMLLQMPILIGFFQLLRTTIYVRDEAWILWIKDLSLKDPVYVLPILMGLTQLVVTKMSPTSGEGSQKTIMYIMPIVMVVIFLSFPSGLNLYWFISNLLQIGQQHIINKKIFHKKKVEDRMRKVEKRKKGGKRR